MATMDWCGKPTDWYKECTSCEAGFWVEADSFNIAKRLMFEHFSGRNSQSMDGLHSICRSCMANQSSGRQQGEHRVVLLESQDGKCAICDLEIAYGGTRGAGIDHDHITGVIRGVLCRRCNTWMAAVDNELWLSKAIAYRNKFRCA